MSRRAAAAKTPQLSKLDSRVSAVEQVGEVSRLQNLFSEVNEIASQIRAGAAAVRRNHKLQQTELDPVMECALFTIMTSIEQIEDRCRCAMEVTP